MKFKKAITGTVLSVGLLFGGTSVFAFTADESYSGSVPKFGGNLWTDTKSASGATQGVKVKKAEENATLYATVTDAAHNDLNNAERPCQIGTWTSIKSGASKGDKIAILLETKLTQNDNITVSYDVDF